MTDPRFTGAFITTEGLRTSWADVPAADAHETLLLALIVQRSDGSEEQFGARWTRDAVDSPEVFAWDTRTVQQRDHEAADTAITRDGGDVEVRFPRVWVDALIDAGDVHAAAVVTVDGVDLEATPLDLDLGDAA
jgi:hypothetical protein